MQPAHKYLSNLTPLRGIAAIWLSFWSASLNNLQDVQEAFGSYIRNDELRVQEHPHPISGPLDFQQRFEFLRFHLDRHRNQVKCLIMEMNERL